MEALEALGIESTFAAQTTREADDDKVGQNDFLTMLVAQLENQDPLNPQDSAAFAAQLAQFSSVEQLIAVREGVDALVANSLAPRESASPVPASGLDPTNLVGRHVTVFGSQIEVDDVGSPVTMNYRSAEQASEAEVVIRDASGREVNRESLLPAGEDGRPSRLRPGDHVYAFDPRSRNLGPGVYSIEFTASNAQNPNVTLLPMVEGTVTGAILAGGEPGIRIGQRIFSVNEVLEVNLRGATRGTAGSAPHSELGLSNQAPEFAGVQRP
jgi:flagellar basal-body rod modification protein FlgD